MTVEGTQRLYKDFPPKWRNQSIPTSSKAAALAGLCTYTAIKPAGLIVQRASWWAVSLLGPSVLPTRSHPLELPIAPALREEFFSILRGDVGKFDELSIHRQRGQDRKGFALLLLRDGSPRAFVKIRPSENSGALFREDEALDLITKFRPRTFTAPATIATGEHGGWRFLALQPLASLIHRTPKRPPITDISEELEAALGKLSRPTSTPEHWLPMHGDLTPWNLRRVGNRLTLFDWEHVGWGPPGSDRTLYQLTSLRLHLTPIPNVEIDDEAHKFWVDRGRAGPRA